MKHFLTILCAGILLCSFNTQALAQVQCGNRGDLDVAFCDDNRDLLADTPEPSKQIKPTRLLLAFSVVEDASAYKVYDPFIAHLSKCTGVLTQTFVSTKEAEIMEAMRTGKVHIASFATGGTMYGVNIAGGIPFAGKGKSATAKADQYKLLLLVRTDSAFKKMIDLKGKTIAHTSQSSNSGNLAPRALFPEQGLIPEKDYTVTYAGKHDKAILGVQYGFWPAAAVASDVFERMIAHKEVKREDFRILYESEGFPTDAFTYVHNLDSKLAEKVKSCFYNYKFTAEMNKLLEGSDGFFPVDYKRDWQVVRLVARAANQKVDRAAYEKMLGRAIQ